MDYALVLRLPQYFRNLQRLSEIVRVLVKHGFGDLVQRINLPSYLESGARFIHPALVPDKPVTTDLGQRMRLVFEELGCTFIKFAQVIATRPDLFPSSIILECRKLQDKAPPFPGEQAKRLVETEFGQPIEQLFATFDERPLAAASISQVHRATLPDGRAVAVKIQRPNLQRIIESDLEILLGVAALVEENLPETRAYSPVKLVEEFSRSLRFECDFRREARSMERFAHNFSNEPDLLVPRVIAECSSQRILTQEFIEGFKADDLEAIQALDIDTAKAADSLHRVTLISIFEHRFFHADPHPGNVFITRSGQVALIDFGAMGRIDETRIAQILQFLIAILSRDLDRLIRVLRDTQVIPRDLDEISLKTQTAEILDNYMGQTLGKLDISKLLTDVFEVVRRYGVKPPPDLLLVGKALTTLEYIAASLDPDFEPISKLRPYLLKRYVRHVTNPKLYSRFLVEVTESYQKLIQRFPEDLRAVLGKVAEDKLSVSVVDSNWQERKRHQNKLVNRIIMASFGITLLVSGVVLTAVRDSRLDQTISLTLIAAGAFTMLLIWFAVRTTGGSR